MTGRALALFARVRAPALLFAVGAWIAACTDDSASNLTPGDPPYVPPPESCTPASATAPMGFPACNAGGGVFGTWNVDGLGLPAYDYGLDENADARAAFFNTERLDRRDHWAQIGNHRVTSLVTNDGYVVVTTRDRGPTLLNVHDEDASAYSGGFSFVDDGEAVWNSAYKWRPVSAVTTRRFGMGYAESSTTHRDVTVLRRVFSPAGDAPAVIDEVTLVNRGTTPKTLKHYEYWDVARRPVEINWLMTGTALAPAARKTRDARNELFDEAVSWDPGALVLGLRRTHHPGSVPPREAPDPVDHYPGDPYLAVLVGEASDLYTDDAAFFGEEGPRAPQAVRARAAGEGLAAGPKGPKGGTSGAGQPRMFVVRSDVTLAPGEKKTLRFAYGYAPMGEPFAVDPHWRDPAADLRREATDAVRTHLLYLASDRDPSLHRELAWDAAALETSVGYSEYFGRHTVPQGSAYLYLHGADGAARDLALFAMPLVYTDAALAREELLLMMGVQRASDHAFSYALQGNGMVDDALGIHAQPSDQDIFFLLAVTEYLGATGDLAFLDAKAPFYPKEAAPDATVQDHVRGALRHLFDVVGTGEHGLVRLGDGDWSDGIVFEAPDRKLAIAKGESVPNTQMAAAVLPRVADLVASFDPVLATETRVNAAMLAESAKAAWTGKFFGRAYFGDGKLTSSSSIDLEAQVWGLIGGTFASPEDRATLVDTIGKELDDPSPTGATMTPGGQVWPAISGLLTWGYALSDDERAWTHLARNTLAAHAHAFPNIWYGIWTAPDGLEGAVGDRPGEAWFSPVTPMTDFPAMNANAHAMPLLAALRVAGVEATARGLSLTPHVPGARFALATERIDLHQDGALLEGRYRPGKGTAPRILTIRAPNGGHVVEAAVDGQSVAPSADGTYVDLPVSEDQSFSARFQ